MQSGPRQSKAQMKAEAIAERKAYIMAKKLAAQKAVSDYNQRRKQRVDAELARRKQNKAMKKDLSKQRRQEDFVKVKQRFSNFDGQRFVDNTYGQNFVEKSMFTPSSYRAQFAAPHLTFPPGMVKTKRKRKVI